MGRLFADLVIPSSRLLKKTSGPHELAFLAVTKAQIARFWSPTPRMNRTQVSLPVPVTDVDAALEQQILDVPQREREPHIHHHRGPDHLGRGVEALEGACRLGSGFYVASARVSRSQSGGHVRLTVPVQTGGRSGPLHKAPIARMEARPDTPNELSEKRLKRSSPKL
jgi:hypothetical protein